MNSSSQSLAFSTDGSGKKLRKPYTITKSRESWSEEEHDKFLEALQLFDRDWKKIEDFVGSKTVIQIRSHAQKYFLKVQKNGTTAHVPPPRPKRKAAHPYPQKAPKNVPVPLPASKAYLSSLSSLAPGCSPWNDTSLIMHTQSVGIISYPEEFSLHGVEVLDPADMGSKSGASTSTSVGGSGQLGPNSEVPMEGIPDFAEVYNFIGSIFDPDTEGHMLKLKEMDPINFETVMLLMKNLTINLSNPDFEPIIMEEVSIVTSNGTIAEKLGVNVILQANIRSTLISSSDVNSEDSDVRNVGNNQSNELSCQSTEQ